MHVRGRGRVSCEGEKECENPVLMIVGPRGQKLHELGTPCPEYPGLRPEYPGCYKYITQKSSPWHYKIPTVGRDIIEGRPIALGQLRYDAIEDLHPLHQDKMASECLVASRRLMTITGIIIDSKFCKLIPP